MKLSDALTENIAAQAKATDKVQKLFDGGGMYLMVHPNGSKYWRLNYRFAGKQNTLSLGKYHEVTLDAARTARNDARKLLANGIDPSDVQKMKKSALRAEMQAKKEALIADEARLIAATRFILDNEGALSFRFGNRHIALTAAETSELRVFLDATRAVIPKVTPCL